MRGDIIDGFEFVPIIYPFNKRTAIRIADDGIHSIKDYQNYICKKLVEQAEVFMPDLEILRFCPTLKYLKICPSYNTLKTVDFSPLYELPEIKYLNCQNIYGNKSQFISEIDYSRINGLVNLFVYVNNGTLNYNKIETLKSFGVGGFKGERNDLTDLFCSRELDTLSLNECRIRSLNGLENSPKLQCLYIYNNRSLFDISALSKVKNTLKALRIENCYKIKDFSILRELGNLELLELSGNNVLPNLNFLKNMKNLKTFVFNMNVLDGDLSQCLNLSYVYSEKNRKHYNLTDAQLPKGEYVRGNEAIEQWRRME